MKARRKNKVTAFVERIKENNDGNLTFLLFIFKYRSPYEFNIQTILETEREITDDRRQGQGLINIS